MAKTHDMKVLHSSDSPLWRTAPELFLALDQEFHFGIDLAANAENRLVVPWLGPGGIADNALDVDWALWQEMGLIHGPGFLNPPYSKQEYKKSQDPSMLVEPWAQRCWQYSQKGLTVVALLPYNPQTAWYRRWVMGWGSPGPLSGPSFHAAREIRKFPHRLSFLKPDGGKAANAGVNHCVVVWDQARGILGPWQPQERYWTYRQQREAEEANHESE